MLRHPAHPHPTNRPGPSAGARVRLIMTLMSALAGSLSVTACNGGAARVSVIARVDGHPITTAALGHWMSALAPAHTVPDPPRFTACVAHQEAISPQPVRAVLEQECREQYRALKQQALELLISSQWLIGEARALGLTRPHAPSSDDARARSEAQTAKERILQALTASEPRPTPAQIAHYYRRHLRRFTRREQRDIDIAEGFPTELAARRFMSSLARGRKLVTADHLHEEISRPDFATVAANKQIEMRAIFKAPAHTLEGPVPLNGYSVFEVTRIVPRLVQPLAEARAVIAPVIVGQQRRRTLARFVRAWRAKWTARTSCLPEYVVPGCRQLGVPGRSAESAALP
jgi:hypothetical protein